MAKFADVVKGLKSKTVTVSIVGVGNAADEFVGALSDVGEDYVELDRGDQGKALIPFTAIAVVSHR